MAARARELRVVVSLEARRLWAVLGVDTLLAADVAVGSDAVLDYQGRRWRFGTPRGVHTVVRKDSLPVWVPPEWHYYEVARARGLRVRALRRGVPVTLADGRRLEIRGDAVGLTGPDPEFTPLPVGEELIFGDVLFVPPLDTRHRRVAGELGRYALDLGDGVRLHGTPHLESVGQPTTHGCLRLRDFDIAWLYEFVPIGTRVYVY